MKILIIPSWYPTSYSPIAGIFFEEQAKYLKEFNIDVGLIYPDLRPLWTFFDKSIFLNRFQTGIYNKNNIPHVIYHGWQSRKLLGRISLKLWIKKCNDLYKIYCDEFGRPDLIHAHCTLPAGIAAMYISQYHGPPYIITEHSTYYARNLIKDFEVPYIKNALDKSDTVVTVSKSLAEILRAYTDKIVQVIPNVVDTEYFTCPPLKTPKKKFVFLSVASLDPKKNIALLIHAFAKKFSHIKNIYLKIVGDGPLKTDLERLVKKLGLKSKVIFTGQLPREKVRSEMWDANVFVLSSNIETFGVVLIEALSTGMPVIATRCGGPEEIVNEKTGYLVEKNNVDELSKSMFRIYSEYNTWLQRRGHIRQYAVMKFSKGAVCNSIIQLYKSLLQPA